MDEVQKSSELFEQIKIICDGQTPVNLDGELRMAKEVDIRLAEEKVRFFYPKGLTWRKLPEKETVTV